MFDWSTLFSFRSFLPATRQQSVGLAHHRHSFALVAELVLPLELELKLCLLQLFFQPLVFAHEFMATFSLCVQLKLQLLNRLTAIIGDLNQSRDWCPT